MFRSIHFIVLMFEGQSLLLGTSYDTSLAAPPRQIFVEKKHKSTNNRNKTLYV
jgi:hypothetical protein